MHSSAFKESVDSIKHITSLLQKKVLFTYLGCHLYIERQRIIYFSDLISKVVSRISRWQSNLLSYSGRAILIKHLLQSLPIHILPAICPPTTTLKQIKCIIPNFFWGWLNGKRKYHWSSWNNMSFPYEEGGNGVSMITNMCKAFQFKQWWTF